jgi:hypothetical protein
MAESDGLNRITIPDEGQKQGAVDLPELHVPSLLAEATTLPSGLKLRPQTASA